MTAPVLRSPLSRWPGWQHLPRDARDTLFLLGVIAWTILPHLQRLPLWCALLTGAMLLWRARLALVNGALPNRWVVVACLVLAVGLTLWTFRTLLGKEPGVTLAVVLMALKTLELRARRDTFVVFFLGFFLVLTHFLYSQSLPVAAAMLVSVWGLLTALVLAHMPVGQPSLRQASTLAARTALLGAPIMVLMFVLFPRIGPLWAVPQDLLSRTGLSNSMRMGSVAELALDDSIALRIRFKAAPPPPKSLYFRGPVLSRFDGTEWRALAPAFSVGMRAQAIGSPLPESLKRPAAPDSAHRAWAQRGEANLRVTGTPIDYEMTLEPTRLTHLPLLEATVAAPDIAGMRVFGADDLQFLTGHPVYERLRFSARAHVEFTYGPTQPRTDLQEHLELPSGQNPRTLAWATALRSNPAHARADAGALADAVLRHITRGGYTYTLAPGEYLGSDAIDQFWLGRREGFCEHFAASFVVIMRAMGVPARIVTGYQGADPVPEDGFYVVRQSAAHAWAEFWQAGIGWVRADPTAAVAPERIQRSINLRPEPGLLAGAVGNVSPALLARMRILWEVVNNRWNQAVLNYSRGDQFEILQRLGLRSPSWEDLAVLLVGSLSLLALAGAAWAWWDRHRLDPWNAQMEQLRRALTRLGLPAAAFESPRVLAHRVRSRFGAQGEPLARLIDRLELQRYGRAARDKPQASLTREFVSAARQLPAPPR
ncbi:MAG: DUF3488 and transglutaminase-like domain-containing protein [Rhizobacter sp.]|nr:DUF3488 and transglutaminase-like domain-containing protein [Rhizobacter sp.]